MNLSDAGLALLKQFEGVRRVAYLDQAGKWTVGVGHLITTDERAAGKYIEPMTDEEIDVLLKHDVAHAETVVNKLVRVALTQNQFDALCSFTYNLGGVALLQSTLLKRLNAHDFAGAVEQFARWNKVRDPSLGRLVPSEGLTKRRAAEAALFLTP